MKYFLKIADNVDVMPILTELQRHPELWNQYRLRKDRTNSPHVEMSDIWVRYRDINKYVEEHGEDFSKFNDEHDGVWYPSFYAIPQLRPIIFGLMARVEGERLGGVLITKIPPGGKIAKHRDFGWHVVNYDKYYISLQSGEGARFFCQDESINPRQGDIYLFDNKHEHWVENNSDTDRITLIVCIQSHKFDKRVK